MLFGPVFRVIVKYNPSQTIMPPHIRGVLIVFSVYPGFPSSDYRPTPWQAGAIAAAPMGYDMPPTFVGFKYPLADARMQKAGSLILFVLHGGVRYSLLLPRVIIFRPLLWAFATKNARKGVEKNSRCS